MQVPLTDPTGDQMAQYLQSARAKDQMAEMMRQFFSDNMSHLASQMVPGVSQVPPKQLPPLPTLRPAPGAVRTQSPHQSSGHGKRDFESSDEDMDDTLEVQR